MAKKKKRSPGEMHRQIQDSLQALPYAIADHQKHGRRWKAVMLRYVGGPILRLMNRLLNAQRYRGNEGSKLKQSEQMRRHLKQRQDALRHVQTVIAQQQKGRKRR
ncbi:MAG: hypothetical protein M3497_06045 [Gemmatimonadota bacterium]|jgi:hypothetical protein|nr:hypothetical protein [Gemmatimonadota bacterium]